MEGCHLITQLYGDTSNMYQFVVFNPDAKTPDDMEFSDVYVCESGLEFELEDDGVYEVVTFQHPNLQLVDEGVKIGTEIYSTKTLYSLFNTTNPIVNVGLHDIDRTFSICNLKKCLTNLELKTFQDMLKNCGKTICKNDEVKSQRDFLFIAVWLIEHYVELGKIGMAEEIYNRIKNCGDICKNLLNDKRSCGCDG